jgi:hypothetical protein
LPPFSLPPSSLPPSSLPGSGLPPPICTGVAAPSVVPGAIAAMWLA